MIITPNKPIAWVGIDPGQTGAAAIIFENGHEVFDWPGTPDIAYLNLIDWKDRYWIELIVLEKAQPMKKNGVKQGVVSTFKFADNFGQWKGMLAALAIPLLLVTPKNWQKGLVSKSDGTTTKERSLAVARRLFPSADLRLKKHHNRADALLMAYKAHEIFNLTKKE